MYCMAQGRLHCPTVCVTRVPYLVRSMKIYSSVQEERDCASIAIAGSPVKSALSRLQQGHRQTDRRTQVSDIGTHTQTDERTKVNDRETHRQTAHAKGLSHYPSTIRQENKLICMYVCMYV